MKKIYLFSAALAVGLASCTNDEFLGENKAGLEKTDGTTQIAFSNFVPNRTRAASGGATAAGKLLNSFDLYGSKTVDVSGTATVQNVFAQDDATDGLDGFGTTTPLTYLLWWDATGENTTNTNVKGWEYVGSAGAGEGTWDDDGTSKPNTSYKGQTIKYWDYSASEYDFVAYKATKGGKVTDITNEGFTFTGSAAQLFGLYVGDKRMIEKDGYGDVVTLTFRNAATKVRVGFYETIPGYKITKMTFKVGANEYENEANLAGNFLGNSGLFNDATSQEFPITFEDPTEDNSRAVIKSESTGTYSEKTETYNFGKLQNDVSGTLTDIASDNALATSITKPTYAYLEYASDDDAYQPVTPNTDEDGGQTGDMKLVVTYVLEAEDGSGESITIKDANATVPKAYMTWQSNYAYTYIFKISPNTNGSTGTWDDDDDPSTPEVPKEGLYPITFDAVVINTEDGLQETITTVENYAVTSYSENSDVTTNAEYKKNNTIFLTVANDNADQLSTATVPTLTDATMYAPETGNAVVYTVTLTSETAGTKGITNLADVTEADITARLNGVNNNLTLAQTTATKADKFSINGVEKDLNNVSFSSAAAGKFAFVYVNNQRTVGNLTLIDKDHKPAFADVKKFYVKQTSGNIVKYTEVTGVTATNYDTENAEFYYVPDGTKNYYTKATTFNASAIYYTIVNGKAETASVADANAFALGTFYTASTPAAGTAPVDGEYTVKVITVVD